MEWIITFVVIFAIAIAVVALIIVVYYNNEKYRQFVKDNSVALAKLKELNDSYQFIKIKNFKKNYE